MLNETDVEDVNLEDCKCLLFARSMFLKLECRQIFSTENGIVDKDVVTGAARGAAAVASRASLRSFL